MRPSATVRDTCEISLGSRQSRGIPRTLQVRELFTRPNVDPPCPALLKAGRGSKGISHPRTSLYREREVRDFSGPRDGRNDRRSTNG